MGMYFKPTIYNVTLANANSEYSQALPADCRKVQISARAAGGDIKLAFVANDSGVNFVTIPVGQTYSVENIYLEGATLYMQTPTPGVVVEILAFS